MLRMLMSLLIAAAVLRATALASNPLETIKGCVLVRTDWADGDSFRIKTPDNREITIRLYGADCLEWHVTDATDERRLRSQRRYFGITNVDPDPARSIELAKNFGEEAAKYVRAALAEPFTVHSAFADARGDGKHKRVYAFVCTHQGADLASDLVSQGLARAFGVYRETHDGRTQAEYRAQLEDLELQAASSRKGIWARTNWSTLPEQRRAQRAEDAELAIATNKAPLQAGKRLNPNTAARDELMQLPGIKEALANRIIERRPIAKPADLLDVPGIGPATLKRILPYLDFPEP